MKKLVALLLTSFIWSAANASLIGTTVHIAQNYPTIGNEFSPVNAVVGPGAEFTLFAFYSVDVGANSIDVNFIGTSPFAPLTAGQTFNGPLVKNIHDSSGNPITGFSNFSSSNSLFTPSMIVFGPDFLGFNAGGITFSRGQNIHVDLSVNPVRAVPEPTSIALLGLGLLGFAASRRKSVK